MITKLITIGEGKGVCLPDSVLEICHIDDTVELEVKDEVIVIRSTRRKARKNWGKAFKAMHENGDDHQVINDSIDLEKWDEH